MWRSAFIVSYGHATRCFKMPNRGRGSTATLGLRFMFSPPNERQPYEVAINPYSGIRASWHRNNTVTGLDRISLVIWVDDPIRGLRKPPRGADCRHMDPFPRPAFSYLGAKACFPSWGKDGTGVISYLDGIRDLGDFGILLNQTSGVLTSNERIKH